MGKLGPKGEKAIEILDKFPKAYTLTLARILFKQYPSLYMDIEDARKILRSHRGETGELNRKNFKYHKQAPSQKGTHELPESWSKKKEFFKLPTAYKNVGLI